MNQPQLQKYSEDWTSLFKFEAEKVNAILGATVKDIQHIGSTSIPGIIAKPIIDIGVLVDSIDTFWERQILFRDYLKKHPELIEEYNDLKLKNIRVTPEEDFIDLYRSKIYNQGKGDFVVKILKLAKEEKSTG